MRFVFFFIAFISLAQAEVNLPKLSEEALQMVHRFQHLHQFYLKKPSPSISLRMVNVKELLFDDSLSSCETHPKVVVLVEKERWVDSNYDEREKILFHTLGHCLLKRAHTSETSFSAPVSIMGLNLKTKDYVKNRELYWFELFKENDIPLREQLIKDNR